MRKILYQVALNKYSTVYTDVCSETLGETVVLEVMKSCNVGLRFVTVSERERELMSERLYVHACIHGLREGECASDHVIEWCVSE
jgi:hypothetical protein